MLKPERSQPDRSPATEPCPYCDRSCDVVAATNGRCTRECMNCGAIWSPRIEYQLEHDPRQELEDPDDRPYLWDLE